MKSLSAGLIIGSALKPDFLELRKVLFCKEFTLFFDPVFRIVAVSENTHDLNGNRGPFLAQKN